MKFRNLLALSIALMLIACGGRPTAPETPDPDAYGKTIQPSTKYLLATRKGTGKPGRLTQIRLIRTAFYSIAFFPADKYYGIQQIVQRAR